MKSTDLIPNLRILVIDDNTSIHADFRNLLVPDNAGEVVANAMEAIIFDEEERGPLETTFEMDSAYQGQEGFEMVKKALAEKRPYAMAFVDVRMPPGWDGIETVARIWEADPQVQIVVCTAYSDYSWEEMRAKVGQPDGLLVLKKPFDNIEVQQLAHALTKKWHLNQQARLQMAELAQVNESLAVSEERFAKAFDESPLPSAIQSLPDQRFVNVNQRLAEVIGCKRDDLIGRTPSELSLWEKPELAAAWYQGLSPDKPVRDQEANIVRKGGGLREMRISLSTLALDGQAHVLLLGQDVSEQALLERQLRQAQKMEAIGQLAAGVAHDFNNILTVITGHAGLMKPHLALNSAAAKSLQEVTRASARAATLIRQLLMFSRKEVMQCRYVALNDILGNAFKMLERIVGEHMQLEFHPQERLPAIYADSGMVEQIAMNLAVNARDAMPDGGRISMKTSLETIRRGPMPMDPEAREGQFVCLTFSDAGVGMDTQILSRIFEPFFTTKAPGHGTGLGLSTVFGIVRQHRGWLNVESKPQHGTTFQIYFPASEKPVERIEAVVEGAPRGGGETVLVAEDEDVLRQMVVQVLNLQGYTVLEAASGPDAVKVWEEAKRPIDLLFTDMVMPGGMMGGELAEHLTGRNPLLKVIYTSGYSAGMAAKLAANVERVNFLPKPYSVAKLAQFVRECLDRPETKTNGNERCVELAAG